MKIIQFFFNFILSLVDYKNKNEIKKFLAKFFINNHIIVFDVGAHKGETIKFFNKNFKILKIFAFEPNPQIFHVLKKKFNERKEVNLYNYGLAENNYSINLNLYKDTSSSSFREIDRFSSYFKRKKSLSFDDYLPNKISCNVVTFDRFLEKEKIKNTIDILKIDTEGYEFNVLQGISKKNFEKIKLIYFEHHYNNMLVKNYKFASINDLLLENNFKMIKKIKMTFRKAFEYIYINKFFL